MNRNPVIVIFLTVFIDLVGFGIIIPLSPYLARNFGANSLEVGLLMAIYSAMQFVFSPVWGQMSDRVGRRPILLISIAGTALAHLSFYFSTTLTMLFVSRALAGLFGANISTAMAYIADVTSISERSKGMGLIGAAFGLGFICGPAVGGILTQFGDQTPALAAALISFVNLIMAFFVLRESLSPERRKERSAKKVRLSRFQSIFSTLQRPTVGVLLFAQFAFAFAMANMEAALFLFVSDRFGWSVQTASYGFAYVGVCIAFTQGFLVRKVLPIFGERVLLIAGFILFSLAMLAVGFSSWIALLAVAMTVLALGNGFINPSLSGSLSLLTPADEQGEVIGVNHALAALARIIGPPVGGYAYMTIAQPSPFFLASLLGVAGLIAVWSVRRSIPSAAKTKG